jgi:hypothetical protein
MNQMTVLKMRCRGRRGEQPWRNRPTDRQKVISERLAENVKEETGLVVDAEIARAVRWTVLRWSERRMFDSEQELEVLTAHAKYERRRAYALNLLNEAEQELSRFMDDALDDVEEEYEDEEI